MPSWSACSRASPSWTATIRSGWPSRSSRRPTSTSGAGRRALLVAIDPALEGPRLPARPGAGGGGRRLRARPRRGALRGLPAAPQTLNACDFGDLLLHGLTLLTTQPGLLARYQQRFRDDPGRRVPGHQRRTVSLAAAARRAATRTSPASATTTSRSTAGAVPRSATSCASSRISRAPDRSAWSATTARPAISWARRRA